MSKITDRMIAEAKDYTIVEEMCYEFDPMIGCWDCPKFDNEFGKQISCPFETFTEKVNCMERVVGLLEGTSVRKGSLKAGISLLVDGKQKMYYGETILLMSIWEKHTLGIGDTIYIDADNGKVVDYGPIKLSE